MLVRLLDYMFCSFLVTNIDCAIIYGDQRGTTDNADANLTIFKLTAAAEKQRLHAEQVSVSRHAID